MLTELVVLCIIALVCVLLFCKKTRFALFILFIIGFLFGLVVEVLGTTRGIWEYSETEMFYLFEIPIEVLIAYGAGLMMAGLCVINLVKYTKEADTYKIIVNLFLIMGVVLFICYIVLKFNPIFSLVFFALWGMSISKRKSVPLILGLATFMTDFIVEGSLTTFTNYYEWTLNVPLTFMLFAIAFAGYMTAGKRGE